MKLVGLNISGSIVACLLACASYANAAAPDYVDLTAQDVGVMERARPAYDAKGIPMGGFRLFPNLDTKSSYDDNVFKTSSPVSDWFFTISPTLRLQSQWGRHFLEVYGGSNVYQYATQTGQNLADWRVGTDGRVDISRAANVSMNTYYEHQHELWSAPNSTGFQAAPNQYFHAHAETVADYQPNRLGFGAGFAFDNYNWQTTPMIGGGKLFNEDRNQDAYHAYAKVYYDFSPGYSGYLKASYDERDYANLFDRTGSDRSSHGYRLDGGVNVKISHLVSGEVFVGYLQQNYAQHIGVPLKDISGFDYGLQLDWYLSPNLTMHVSGERTLEDVVLAGISSADNRRVAMGLDYEFRPNIILQLGGVYNNVAYAGSNRTDEVPGVNVGIKYLINRYASLNFAYDYGSRSSNLGAFNYHDNTASVGLSLHI
ncbi:hypothetical protein FHS83_001664 [Rhizomicrobium palustre]|uniref:Outer membrane beta-barrel protein n=1 Tax=Rhizomicrobium palustre TaxID=189966 RepID=A0A846MY73_9PROT|nr:outer membrane beta-barrel protein [Rhizomicrobium palustre]NIK88346.1 hypothetical protein [Rhizomicrobium palustre]